MNDPLIALSVLALELEVAPQRLAKRLADVVLTDDIGRPAVDRVTAAALVAERNAKAAARRAHRPRGGPNETVQRVQAIAEHQRALGADAGVDALSLMRMASGEDGNLARAGRRWDELAETQRRGDLGAMHRFQPREVEQ